MLWGKRNDSRGLSRLVRGWCVVKRRCFRFTFAPFEEAGRSGGHGLKYPSLISTLESGSAERTHSNHVGPYLCKSPMGDSYSGLISGGGGYPASISQAHWHASLMDCW